MKIELAKHTLPKLILADLDEYGICIVKQRIFPSIEVGDTIVLEAVEDVMKFVRTREVETPGDDVRPLAERDTMFVKVPNDLIHPTVSGNPIEPPHQQYQLTG